MAEPRLTQIHIADNKTDEILDFIPETDFWNDERKRSLTDNRDTFDFETFATESYSGALEERNRIIIPNRHDQSYSEFIIEEAAQIMDDSGLHFKATYTVASYLELRKQKQIPPQTILAQTPQQHVDFALNGTEWKAGDIAYAPNHTTVLTAYMDAYSYLQNVASWSGLELRFRVEHNGYQVTGRYVDLVERAGVWRGHEAVFGKDLMSIERRRKFDAVVTALIGLGPSNEDGGAREEVYIESEAALARWGRNGMHLVEVFEPQSEDQNINPAKLHALTQEELNRRISHQSEYAATVSALADALDAEPGDIQFGDIIRIKDEEFNPPIYLEARIHEMTESIKEYGEAQVVLGDFTEFSEDEVKSILKRLRQQIADKVTNAQLVEAIEAIETGAKVTQPTPPSDTSVIWIDNSNRPLITKVYIDAVEGWVPIMPSTAAEIGADPLGSAAEALAFAREDIAEVVSTLNGFRNEYDDFIADGFISRAEALSIERHILALNSEKADLDSDYTVTYANAKLTGSPKTNLQSAKTAYNAAHTALVNAINTAIADGYVTPAEKTTVNNAFASYNTSLGSYSTARANAANAITAKSSTDAQTAAEATASADATTKANNARDAAISAAATDAQTKATAAQNAAIAAANTKAEAEREIAKAYADGIVDAEELARIQALNAAVTAAAADAQNKATAAQTAAEAYALLIAEDKAAEAQSAAAEYAALLADTAKLEMEAYADGILTDEEQSRMAEAEQVLAEAKAYAEQMAAEAVAAIDTSHLATKDELVAEAEAIRDQFSSRGGANLLKNSIGYANMDFWTYSTSNTNVIPVMNEGLTTLGFGSGFFFEPDGTGKGIRQTVNVIPGEEYTLGWYLQKATAGSFTIDILHGTTVIATTPDITTVGGGYAGSYLTFTPTQEQVTIRFTAAGTTEATLTGIMLSIGNLPAQWTLATGELYNAYVRADEKGLLVLGLDASGNIERKTVMSPEEFAGYYDENRDGNFERVFWLNQDETVTKKLRALDEITMGTIKIVRVTSAYNRGWAFVPIVPE